MWIFFKKDKRSIVWSASTWAKELECSEVAIKKKDNKAWQAVMKDRQAEKSKRLNTGYLK